MKLISYPLLTVLLSISSLTSFSQEISLYWGKEVETSRFNRPIMVVGQMNGNLIMLEDQRKGMLSRSQLSISRFSMPALASKGSSPLTVKAPKNQEFEKLAVCAGKIYLFTSQYDKERKKNVVYAQQVDEYSKFIGGPKKIDDIKTDSKSNRGSFEVIQSNDSTKILIVNNPPFSKYADEKFGFKVLGSDLQVVSNKEVRLPYRDKKFSVSNYSLADDGTIFMLAKVELERKEKEKGQADYYYEIISVAPSAAGEVREFDLKLADQKVVDIGFSQNIDGSGLLCAGFYTDVKGKTSNEIKGLFFLKINTRTREVESKSFKDFDKSFVEELTSKRKAKRGHGIQATFTIKDFLKKADGGILAIAENSYDYVEVTTTRNSSGFTSTRRRYHYVRNNIIAINVSPEGEIMWYVNVPKRQHTVDDGGAYISYIAEHFNGKTYFIFNDHKKNVLISDPKKLKDMRNLRSSVTTMIELDESGKYEKILLQTTKDSKFIVFPKLYYKLGERDLIICAYKLNSACCFLNFSKPKYKLGRLTF